MAVTGTLPTICVSLQLLMEAADCPLKLTTLVPWAAPNPTPATVTDVPTGPLAGVMPVTVMTGMV